MKQFKLAVMALFALVIVSNVNAQDKNNPWAVSFGANIVDFYQPGSISGQFDDFVGSSSDWNILPSVTRVSLEKYIEKGFSLQLSGSFNKITSLNTVDDSDFLYYSVDAIVKYDLNDLLGETSWFDPFVYIGGGYATANDQGEGMLNVGLGFNTWFNENLGINFQTGSKSGFTDKVAAHLQTSLGLVIKFGGTDTDGDGVYDKFDDCIDVPGLVAFNGCPDSDGDGIKDSEDACPNEAGLAIMNGCPDADGDGIADKDDACPNAKGTKENKGCPDSDGDGVVDKDDKCVSQAGPAANAGCPWPDTDGDSILDKDDKCPNEAGVASEGGCPEIISNEAQMGMNSFAKAILFHTEKATFKAGVTKELDGMLAIMNKFPLAEFAVKGYTDTTGSVSGNLKLSDKRANAVKNYLVENGIDASRLTAKGYGQDSPIDTNDTRVGRTNNRRVEVK
ncbi:MAG: OmpA family protein, partial [Polaribacter sp.]|nr:OmpA family protein [Polaribacter sp.]